MHGLSRVQEVARCAGGGERRGDLSGHEPSLADSRHHHAASALADHPHAAAEVGIERVGGAEHRLSFDAEDPAAVRENVVVVEVIHETVLQAGTART